MGDDGLPVVGFLSAPASLGALGMLFTVPAVHSFPGSTSIDLLLSADALGMKLLRFPFWAGFSEGGLGRCAFGCAVIDGSVGIRDSRGMPEGRVGFRFGFGFGLMTDSSIVFVFPYSFILYCIVTGSMNQIGNRSGGEIGSAWGRAMKQSFGGRCQGEQHGFRPGVP